MDDYSQAIDQRLHIEEPGVLKRIRRWFFTPKGALVYFGIGYALLGLWIFWGS